MILTTVFFFSERSKREGECERKSERERERENGKERGQGVLTSEIERDRHR